MNHQITLAVVCFILLYWYSTSPRIRLHTPIFKSIDCPNSARISKIDVSLLYPVLSHQALWTTHLWKFCHSKSFIYNYWVQVLLLLRVYIWMHKTTGPRFPSQSAVSVFNCCFSLPFVSAFATNNFIVLLQDFHIPPFNSLHGSVYLGLNISY